MKTLYVIHHSHTDIGYTTDQESVRRNHIGFIRQILTIIKQRGMDCGFRWTCESFWAVEQFLCEANENEKEQFNNAVCAGVIGLSANYANFSELLCQEALTSLTARATAYGKQIGHHVNSAMNADINGFGWGYGKALAGNGVENLFTCIHTHHGMYPLQRHRPFWWVGPDGEKLLVWNGEHYHLGNELGLCPGAVSSYMTKDECDAHAIYHEPRKVAEIRIPRLFRQLEEEGYPYQFLPVMISGLRSDNGPPNAAILDQINWWNDIHGHEIRVEMVTLDQFFVRLRSEKLEIPTYSGDWPDWWTDGTASMPEATALFRNAQRTWQVAGQLIASKDSADFELLNNLAMYAEHTYGHAASVVQPFHLEVNALSARKKSFAAIANEEANTILASELSRRGMAEHGPDLPLRYRVINPSTVRVTDVARLKVEHHEYYEKYVYRGIQVKDESDDELLPAGIDPTPVTTTVLVPLTLDPGQEKVLCIHPSMTRDITPDKAAPTLEIRQPENQNGVFETDAFRIEWKIPVGITAWIDKASGCDILRDKFKHAPFMPVHSITPMTDADEAWSVRGSLGLSRSGAKAQWSEGKVVAVRERFSDVAPGNPIEDSRKDKTTPMHQCLEFDIEVDGCSECSLILEATAGLPRIDLTFNVNKQSIWAPENLYLSLPLGHNSHDTIWLDKSGGMVRARKDQLSGSLIDYYSVQNGIVIEGLQGLLALSMRDNPLLQLGPLEYQESRVLHNPDQHHPDQALPYAWLMTNYWETNFSAGLGGFHSFRFSVLTSCPDEPQDCVPLLQAANTGFVCFRLNT